MDCKPILVSPGRFFGQLFLYVANELFLHLWIQSVPQIVHVVEASISIPKVSLTERGVVVPSSWFHVGVAISRLPRYHSPLVILEHANDRNLLPMAGLPLCGLMLALTCIKAFLEEIISVRAKSALQQLMPSDFVLLRY